MVGVSVAICFHADKTGNTEAAREHHTYLGLSSSPKTNVQEHLFMPPWVYDFTFMLKPKHRFETLCKPWLVREAMEEVRIHALKGRY